MANKDDEHNKEKIRSNKHDYGKELDALFEESITDRDKAYAHYIDANRQICLRVSKKLGEIISHDNFDSMMKGEFTYLIDFGVYPTASKILYQRWKSREREYMTSRTGN